MSRIPMQSKRSTVLPVREAGPIDAQIPAEFDGFGEITVVSPGSDPEWR